MNKKDDKLLMIVDVLKCVGCFNCLMACKDEHVDNDWKPYTGSQQLHGQKWIDPSRHERGKAPYTDVCFVTRLCMHCSDPACAKAVPAAIDRRKDGAVLIDTAEAARGEELKKACPYGMISVNEDSGDAQKCTFCAHLLDEGWKEPRCVQACPLRALSVVKCSDAEYDSIVEAQSLRSLHEGAERPRVMYKNLDRYTSVFVAGSLAITDEAKGVEVAAEGAEVKLSLNGEPLAEQEVDWLGEFKFDHIPKDTGSFDIECTLDGYKPVSLKAEVKDVAVVLDTVRFVK
jgi:Fe-S-cluster-containing dehydrogenase component